jgi:hypothetical protein
MIKFTSKTRIKVSARILDELGLKWWEHWSLRVRLKQDYDMLFTSKRGSIFYFKVLDEKKFLLFSLNYGGFILKK